MSECSCCRGEPFPCPACDEVSPKFAAAQSEIERLRASRAKADKLCDEANTIIDRLCAKVAAADRLAEAVARMTYIDGTEIPTALAAYRAASGKGETQT